jgi:hypothetical protein
VFVCLFLTLYSNVCEESATGVLVLVGVAMSFMFLLSSLDGDAGVRSCETEFVSVCHNANYRSGGVVCGGYCD